MSGHFRGRAGADNLTTPITALRPEINDPVGRTDDVEVVLDDQQRMSGSEQLAKCAQELCDILEVQPGCRLVKQKQLAAMGGAGNDGARFSQMPCQLEPLCFTSGKSRYGLSQLYVLESYI